MAERESVANGGGGELAGGGGDADSAGLGDEPMKLSDLVTPEQVERWGTGKASREGWNEMFKSVEDVECFRGAIEKFPLIGENESLVALALTILCCVDACVRESTEGRKH